VQAFLLTLTACTILLTLCLIDFISISFLPSCYISSDCDFQGILEQAPLQRLWTEILQNQVLEAFTLGLLNYARTVTLSHHAHSHTVILPL
jgi:hypothetical protein